MPADGAVRPDPEIVVNAAQDAILTIDTENRIRFANPAAGRLFGYTTDELVGTPLADLMPPELRAAHRAGMKRYLETGVRKIPWSGVTVPGQTRSGGRLLLEISFGRSGEGGEQLFTGILRDVTERIAQEERQERLAELSQRAQEALLAFLEKDPEPALKEMLGRLAGALGGGSAFACSFAEGAGFESIEWNSSWTTFDARVAERDPLAAYGIDSAELGPALDESLHLICPVKGEHPGETLLLFGVRYGPELVGLVGFTGEWETPPEEACALIQAVIQAFAASLQRREHDRMDTVLREKLSDALERSMAAGRLKSEFLANVSHEIRSPMAAILGYAELLEHGRDTRESATWLGQLRQNADHLLKLLEDILDLSRIEAGKLEIRAESIRLADLVEESTAPFLPRFAEKLVDFSTTIDDDVPAVIECDSTRVRQILTNLVSNAWKYTDVGSVGVHVSHGGDADDGCVWLNVTVRDTGIGIPSHRLTDVFEPFQRVHGEIGGSFSGVGLGLDICRRLCDLLDARIEVRSVEGSGSEFELALPVRPGSLPAQASEPAESGEVGRVRAGARVLLVEDGEDNRRIFLYLLENEGLVVDVAVDGLQGFERALEQARAATPYDVILMDLQMPVLDGLEATRRLRAEGIETPIVALTAFAMARDAERCFEAGCSDYLAKPVTPSDLFRTLARLLPQAEEDCEPLPSTMANDPDFAPLLAEYFVSLRDMREQLMAFEGDGGGERLLQIVHRLAGSARSYGYDEISEFALAFQERLRTDQGDEGAEGRTRLVRLIERALAAA